MRILPDASGPALSCGSGPPTRSGGNQTVI
jgi:hypothetical protein